MKYSFGRLILTLFSIFVIGITTFLIINNYFFRFINKAAPVSSPTPFIPQATKNDEIESPDGTMKLTMQTTNSQDAGVIYTFFTEDLTKKNKKQLFSITGAEGEFTLPQNSWSPDNSHLFLLQKKNNLVNALIFKIVEDDAHNNQYIDLLSHYSKMTTENTITDITGWDSSIFLHVMTNINNTTIGPSYWFDVTSQIFMQIAGR